MTKYILILAAIAALISTGCTRSESKTEWDLSSLPNGTIIKVQIVSSNKVRVSEDIFWASKLVVPKGSTLPVDNKTYLVMPEGAVSNPMPNIEQNVGQPALLRVQN
jgi:hypothetical protein